MILKSMDEHAAELATIERLLHSDPPDAISRALKKDRAAIHGSLKHQRDSTYHLDFFFKESQDWAVLHDLRLEIGEQVAQIDHLLIGRQLDIYVIESRYYNSDVKIDESGAFHCMVNKKPVMVASPIARNQRYVEFLQQYLRQNGLLPSRLGLTIKPRFHSVVLLSPTSRVTLLGHGGVLPAQLMRADVFLKAFKKSQHGEPLTDFVNLARQLSAEALHEIAYRLANRHIPRSIDFAARYGLRYEQRNEVEESPKEGSCRCAMCNKRITSRVARYCYTNKEAFAGKIYCFDCQREMSFQVGSA